MADPLLDAFMRPDDLVQHQLSKEFRFDMDHRKTLAAVERIVNPEVAPVTDGANDPVQLVTAARQDNDRVDLPSLVNVRSDEAYNKVVTVLATLLDEIHTLRLAAEDKYYPRLATFGITQDEEPGAYTDGVLEAMMGRTLPLLQDCHNFCLRINALVSNLVHQFLGLYSRGSPVAAFWWESNVSRPIMHGLGEALTTLITIDTLIRENPCIGLAWEKFKKTQDVMKMDPGKYGADAAAGAALDELVTTLDRTLMAPSPRGGAFRECLDQPAFEPMPFPDAQDILREPFKDGLMEALDVAVRCLRTPTETEDEINVVGLFAVYVLQRVLTRRHPPDRRAFERVWRYGEVVPLVSLYTRHAWLPDRFLLDYSGPLPLGVTPRTLIPKDFNAVRMAAADAAAEALPAFAAAFAARVASWSVSAMGTLSPTATVEGKTPPLGEFVRVRGSLLLQAVCLAYEGRRVVTSFLLHQLALKRDFRRSTIDPLSRVCENLKVLHAEMRRYGPALVETLPFICRQHALTVWDRYKALRLILETTVKSGSGSAAADAARSPAGRTLLSSVELLASLFATTEAWHPVRRCVLALATSVGETRAKVGLKDADAFSVREALWAINIISDYDRHMLRATDCSVLFHVRELAPVLVQLATGLNAALTASAGSGASGGSAVAGADADARQGSRLHHVFTALSDAGPMLAKAVHMPAPLPHAVRLALTAGSVSLRRTEGPESPTFELEHPLTAYEAYLIGILRADVVRPLCRAVETDLRVRVHAVHLGGAEPPSPRGTPAIATLVHLLRLPPVHVLGAAFDIKQEVTHELEATFYQLTTVALHDWRTYGEMAAVAADKYGLALTNNHLPMGSLDQGGLDVLQIMRNIHVFVSRYNYNLNQQFFVEKRGVKGSKHLNSVSINSISASIRQHGTGMMNTTVNFAYQFLARKVYVFSQFLFDEQIKLFLQRERRWYRAKRKVLEGRFPYASAAELCKEIRKMGLTEDKQSFLDKFRQLISEIGNALGYVRMVRTAGMHAAAAAVSFVPDPGSIPAFREAAEKVVLAPPAPPAEEDDGSGAAPPPPPPGAGAGLSPETLEAASLLDSVLTTLNLKASTSGYSSSPEGVDYFKLLVTVFQHSLLSGSKAKRAEAEAGGEGGGAAAGGGAGSDPSAPATEAAAAAAAEREDSHLKNFFLCIPALTLSYVEAFRAAKERMDKGVKGVDAFFTDDGFGMGLAYMLAVLKQDRSFDSLHWWDSVARYHAAELEAADKEAAELGKGKLDKERADELEFRRKKLLGQAAEFTALYHTFSGARTFFKVDTEGGDVEDAIAQAV